jgi:diaminopimelate epimerase
VNLGFAKMEGAGNDFVVLDYTHRPFDLDPERLRGIADRHFGIGCDQILVVERPRGAGADFRYRIFNADGGEVEQCGNGARCFVKFVHARGLTAKREIRVETLGGPIVPRLEPDGEVSVDMGPPAIESPLLQTISLDGSSIEVTILSIGNPHVVQVPRLEQHPRFPDRVNAGYLQVLDRGRIALRVWERGAGETLSCGTGACAAAVTGVLRGLLDTPVRVATRGGGLTISWAGSDNAVWLKGPARLVYEGTIEV